MPKAKLITAYSKLSDSDLNTTAQTVGESLAGNDFFPTTTPPLTEVTSKQRAFNAALAKAVGGDRTAIALKNQFREDLLGSMAQLAGDIETQANGDKAKLISSGFELASDGDSAPPLDAPTDFRIEDGLNKGELKFSCRKVAQAVSYLFAYTVEEPRDSSRWITRTSTSRETIISGFAPGTRVHGRVTATGRKGQERTSEVMSRIVQ